jgi:hypothetical protein
MTTRSHKKLIAVLDWIAKENQRTKDFAGKTCIFGVGLPSAIASHRMAMLSDLIKVIDDAGEEESND